MEFIAAKCPNCGGDLQLPDDKKQVKCKYCGFDIVVREAINKAQANFDNFLKLASSAQETGNYQESYDYFTKVLEFDADNYLAHWGKGLCAAKLSTPEKFRFDELKTGIVNAVNNAPEDKKDEVKTKAVKELDRICHQNISRNGLKQPLLSSSQKIEGYEIIYSFNPQNVNLLEKIILELSFWDKDKREKYLDELQAIAPEKALAVRETLESRDTIKPNSDRKKTVLSKKFQMSLDKIGEITGLTIAIVIILIIVLFCAYCGSR